MLDDATLDALRQVGDPEADEVVAELFAGGPRAIAALNEQLRGLVRNDQPVDDYPEALRDFLAATDPVGTFAGGWDEDRVRAGATLPHHYTVHLALVLQFGTMPVLYAARRGVEVLGFTGRLHSEATRRSVETAQMVFDVNRPGGLLPDGVGRRSSQRVRLLHATVRHHIRRSGRWDAEQLGVPINQEDLLGTLGAFSILIVDCLQRMGAQIPDELAEDFVYRWAAVGQLLGIRRELLPTDVATARALFARIQQRQLGASAVSDALLDAWVEENRAAVGHLVSAPAVLDLMRFFVGPRAADCLGMGPSERRGRLYRAHRRALARFDRHLPHASRRRALADDLCADVLRRWHERERGPWRPSFGLPVELRDRRAAVRAGRARRSA